MTIELDIRLTKLFIPLADIKGTVEVSVLAEFLTGGLVRQRLIDGLREKGFTGTVVIDGEKVEL